MRLLRMMPGYGETLIAEGDPALDAERELLVREFIVLMFVVLC